MTKPKRTPGQAALFSFWYLRDEEDWEFLGASDKQRWENAARAAIRQHQRNQRPRKAKLTSAKAAELLTT